MFTAYFAVKGFSLFNARYHGALFFSFVLAALVGLPLLLPLLPPRYMELVNVVAEFHRYIQPSIEFNAYERGLLSTRLVLWTKYIEEFIDGNIANYVFGFGPFSYEAIFRLNAHSSYVSYLYEYGVFGLLSLVFIIVTNAPIALSVRGIGMKLRVFSLHVGFVLLNLTTGALKSIEGVVVYAIIMAVTFAKIESARPVPATPLPRALDPAKAR
jgi:O-antigen ligase